MAVKRVADPVEEDRKRIAKAQSGSVKPEPARHRRREVQSTTSPDEVPPLFLRAVVESFSDAEVHPNVLRHVAESIKTRMRGLPTDVAYWVSPHKPPHMTDGEFTDRVVSRYALLLGARDGDKVVGGISRGSFPRLVGTLR